MPSRRQERVSKRIMQELVEAFRDLKNVDLGFITVTRCEVSPDLRHAKVFVSVYGDEERRNRTLAALKHNASRLKGIIGRPLGTKVVPSLHFEFDESIATADHMSQLIRDARQTDVNPEPLAAEELERFAAENRAAEAARAASRPEPLDAFDEARMDVEEELFDDGDDDDPDWRPIDLDELPDDGE